MTDTDENGSGTPPTDDRLRMDLYELLHHRAETERKWQFWRLAAGHAVVGVILAYAFVFGRWEFVALTPILYGVVVIDGLKFGVRMLYLQQHLVELESKLSGRDPLFSWVTRYGFFGAGREVSVEDVDLNRIPELAQFLLIATIYGGLIVVSLAAWDADAGVQTTVGVAVTRDLLLLGYASFTALFGAIVLVGYFHYRRVERRVAEVTTDR